MITYPEHIEKALQELYNKGFAVAIFTPNELQGVEAYDVEVAMVKSGWDTINYIKDPNIPNYDWENNIEKYPD